MTSKGARTGLPIDLGGDSPTTRLGVVELSPQPHPRGEPDGPASGDSCAR